MGQAKLRGTPEQRQAMALQARRAQFPDSITCNNCQADLTDITPMDTRGIPGLRLAGGAHCKACDHTTWVIDGTLEAKEALAAYLAEQHGGDLQVGTARR